MGRGRVFTNDFASLWVKSQSVVSSYVFASIRDTHEAEDVLQDVARAAFEDFERYDADRPFVAWVMGIARFRILKYYRSRSTDKLVFDDDTLKAIAAAHETLDDTAGERRMALDTCMKKLHERGRKVLALRYLKDLQVHEVADRIGATANAVSVLLYKLRAALADCIRRKLAQGGEGRP